MGEVLSIVKTTDQLEPTVLVIFGGAGDLTWRKLVPALFDLSQDRSMPADFSVIAVDRVPMSDEKLRQRLHNGVNQFSRFGKAKDAAWNQFATIALARIAAISQVTLILVGWCLAQYPNLVTPDLTVSNAHAPKITLRLLIVA